MKKIKYLLLAICIMLSLTGCIHRPQAVYYIGQEYLLGDLTVKTVDEKENERYVIYCIDAQSRTEEHYFDFNFTYNTCLSLRNSDEFEYTDDLGNDIIFDEKGYFCFSGSRTFYVSYKNSSEEIKQAIKNEECNISFGVGLFVYYHTAE